MIYISLSLSTAFSDSEFTMSSLEISLSENTKHIEMFGKVFVEDTNTNSYISHETNEICWVLVYSQEELNWKGFVDIEIIDHAFGKYGKSHNDWTWKQYQVVYELYKKDIVKLQYYPCDDDAGSNNMVINFKLYMETYQPDVYKMVTDCIKKSQRV